MKKNGFTLIELLAVLVIIGILSAISIAIYTNTLIDSRNSLSNVQKTLNIIDGDFYSEDYQEGVISQIKYIGLDKFYNDEQEKIKGLRKASSINPMTYIQSIMNKLLAENSISMAKISISAYGSNRYTESRSLCLPHCHGRLRRPKGIG